MELYGQWEFTGVTAYFEAFMSSVLRFQVSMDLKKQIFKWPLLRNLMFILC